jgi:hypothetical protein
MKKFVILGFSFILAFNIRAQNVENPSFDSIYIGGIDRIFEWITSDAWSSGVGDTILPLDPDSHYIANSLMFHEALNSVQIEYSNAYDGPYAVKVLSDSNRVKNDGNNFQGFIVNGNHFYTDSTGYLDLKKCGTPFTYRPYSLKGFYKFEDQSPSLHNYPRGIVLLKKYNPATHESDTIGFSDQSIIFFGTSTWRAFEMPITYFSNQSPDSVIISFQSSPLRYVSTFRIDSLGFDYNFPAGISSPVKSERNIFQYDALQKSLTFFPEIEIRIISFYDMNGKLVFKKEIPLPRIDVSALPPGNYILNVEYRNGSSESFKIVF